MNISKIVLMRCLPAAGLPSAPLQPHKPSWWGHSHGVTGLRAWSLPPAHKPEPPPKDTQRWALAGGNPMCSIQEKEIFLKDKAMLPAEKEWDCRDTGNRSESNQQQHPHAVAPQAPADGPAPAPGEVWIFPLTRAEDAPQQRQHQLLTLAQAAPSASHSQKNW